MTRLHTFCLPEHIDASKSNILLGKNIVSAWRKDGIIQIPRTKQQEEETARAFEENELSGWMRPRRPAFCGYRRGRPCIPISRRPAVPI